MSRYLDFKQLESLSNGRWQYILIALGLPSSTLINRHQPCPCCGGRDRFRFDDKEGSGSFICTHFGNGGGNGFQLVQHWLDCDFRKALEAVASILIGNNGNKCLKLATDNLTSKDHSKALEKIWRETEPVMSRGIVSNYLENRGLNWELIKNFDSGSLRLHPSLPYWGIKDEQHISLGKFPAMIAKIEGEDRNLKGLHLTYLQQVDGRVNKLAILDEDGVLLPSKKMRSCFAGSLKEGSIQLYPCTDQLAVCEGIETAFAIREASGLPVWACLSANGLQSLALPNTLKKLYIYCDNDLHAQGFRAGHNLMVRAIKSGIKAHIWQPKQLGWDALDVLVASKQKEAA